MQAEAVYAETLEHMAFGAVVASVGKDGWFALMDTAHHVDGGIMERHCVA